MVHADPAELQQALLNCCINARDSMDGTGELAISTELVHLDETYCRRDEVLNPGRYVCISISDTGWGMPPDAFRRIFEPFFTTKDFGAGTGLGLARVYGLVKQHHGHIDVESEVSHGTTFRIYIPAVTEPELAESSVPAPMDHHEESEVNVGTILIVDDEKLLRRSAVFWTNTKIPFVPNR